MTPRVSVIIPSYNRAGFLREAVQSVLDQTFSDWELIVVDDGSEDDTAAVMATFGRHVKYIYQCRAGQVGARNTGIAAAQGDYIFFLDSDDIVLPHTLEKLVSILDTRPDIGAAYGWYAFIDASGQPSSQGGPKLPGLKPIPWGTGELIPCGPLFEGQILRPLLLNETMLLGTVLIRRDWVTAVRGFRDDAGHQAHWDFFLRLARAGCRYRCGREVVLLLRRHADNMSHNLEAVLASRLAVVERFVNDPELTAELEPIRARAYYNTYVEAAVLDYRDGHVDRAAQNLGDALGYAPLERGDFQQLAFRMTSLAISSRIESPLRFLTEHFRTLPASPEVRRLRRVVLSRVYRRLASDQYQANGLTPRAVWYALRATSLDMSRLRSYLGTARRGLTPVMRRLGFSGTGAKLT